MNGKAFYSANEFFTPFPNPQDVFASDIELHSEYLAPIGSLSLQLISPELTGEIHFVFPKEPPGMCGVKIAGQESTLNYLCRKNWLGFNVRNDKYEFATDFRFFSSVFMKKKIQ